MCGHFSGKMLLPQSQEDFNSLIQKLDEFDILESTCRRLWVPVVQDYNEETGETRSQNTIFTIKHIHLRCMMARWVTGKNKEAPRYLPWGRGQPNGRHLQQCVAAVLNIDSKSRMAKVGYYNDDNCEDTRCFVCNVPETMTYKLRGLATGDGAPLKSGNVDASFYTEDNLVNGKHSFLGFNKNRILWSPDLQMWTLVVTETKTDLAATEAISPLGLHVWNIIDPASGSVTDNKQILKITKVLP